MKIAKPRHWPPPPPWHARWPDFVGHAGCSCLYSRNQVQLCGTSLHARHNHTNDDERHWHCLPAGVLTRAGMQLAAPVPSPGVGVESKSPSSTLAYAQGAVGVHNVTGGQKQARLGAVPRGCPIDGQWWWSRSPLDMDIGVWVWDVDMERPSFDVTHPIGKVSSAFLISGRQGHAAAMTGME